MDTEGKRTEENPIDHFDYLIVGALCRLVSTSRAITGLFGSTFARLATDAGKKCLVIEARDHVGGNLYCEKIAGIATCSMG